MRKEFRDEAIRHLHQVPEGSIAFVEELPGASTHGAASENRCRGRFLHVDQDRPLCLACADLDHLVFLPSGDAALTRRAGRYSTLRAVVVRFSRARKRYERQGILVEEEAPARAEEECLSDSDSRQRARERAAEKRRELDAAYVEAFAGRIGELFPGCSDEERRDIAEHACEKHSRRVGRFAAAKELQENAVELAVRAHIRHTQTRYDALRSGEVARDEARAMVAPFVEGRLREMRHGSS